MLFLFLKFINYKALTVEFSSAGELETQFEVVLLNDLLKLMDTDISIIYHDPEVSILPSVHKPIEER